MSEQHDSVWLAVGKVLAVVAAWFGTIKLADVQALVAICSGLVVAGYAATQWWVLWRDKIKRKDEA
jgi:O-antigen/teichoic acid export membrane protein